MTHRPPRNTLIPNANNVRFLTRLLEFVAQGVRDPRALAEVLDCEPRTVHYYTQAGDWLGLLETEKTPHLTRLGLEYVYAGTSRSKVYAEAVWNNPFVIDLMAGKSNILPPNEEIAAFIQTAVPEMAPSTSKRRASAVRGLIEPAIKFGPNRSNESRQLTMEFGPSYESTATATPILDLRAGIDQSPDVYRIVLHALLNHGELGTGAIRAILDKAGANDCSVGSYIEMALRRGDASRIGEKLVVTWGAVWRRDVADTVVGIALSDPRYRDYLSTLIKAAHGDAREALRFSSLRDRWSGWDRRVFGEAVRPSELGRDLDNMLLGRPLDDFPLAGNSGEQHPESDAPFLNIIDREGLVITFPPSLALLLQGASIINRTLDASNRTKNGVRLPAATDPRSVVHGGLFHPKSRKTTTVPDLVSLRLMAISNIPHIAMATALLLLDRRPGMNLMIERSKSGPKVLWEGTPLDTLMGSLDFFADSRGWMVSRQSRVSRNELLGDLLVALGIAERLANRLILAEAFFIRLKEEPEDQDVAHRLSTLQDLIQRHFEEMGC
jgi:hypothetical protein